MRRSVLIAASLALSAAATTSVQAQRSLSVGLAGGVSLPSADLSDGASAGWHGIGTLWLSSSMQPMGLRVDVAHNRFAFSDEVQAVLGDGDQTTTSATVNLTYRFPSAGWSISPYLVTGLGAYRIDCSVGCDASTHYGWNVGLGSRLHLLSLRSFIEARYHRTGRGDRDVHFFPITLGFLF